MRALLGLIFCLQIAACAQTQSLPIRLGDLDREGVATVKDLQLPIHFLNSGASVATDFSTLIPTGTNAPGPRTYLDLDDNGVIDQNDLLPLRETILGNAPLPPLPVLQIIEALSANGEELVSPARESASLERELEKSISRCTKTIQPGKYLCAPHF